MPARDAFGFANKAVASIADSNNRARLAEETRNMARGADRKGLETQQQRRWNVGDVYAPHDLSGVEQSKWKSLKQKARPRWDVLDQLNLKPMDHYKVRRGVERSGGDRSQRAWSNADNNLCRTSASCLST